MPVCLLFFSGSSLSRFILVEGYHWGPVSHPRTELEVPTVRTQKFSNRLYFIIIFFFLIRRCSAGTSSSPLYPLQGINEIKLIRSRTIRSVRLLTANISHLYISIWVCPGRNIYTCASVYQTAHL